MGKRATLVNQLPFAWRYALGNLGRNPRRTAMTFATLIFAVSMTIIAQRYSAALMQLWQDGAADTGTGHARLFKQGYFTKQEGVDRRLSLKEGSDLEEILFADDGVEATVRRLRIEGLMAGDLANLYFLGIGVEPTNELRVSPRLFTDNDTGSFVSDDDPSGIAIGRLLASSLNLSIGDEVTLVAPTVDGSVNGIDVHVVGIVDASIPSFSKRTVYAHIDQLRRLVRLDNSHTEIAVRLKPAVEPSKFVASYKSRLAAAGGDLRGWWEVEPMIRNIEKIWDNVVACITGLLFLTTGLSILNIIYMMVSERSVEIGTLMAIGAKRRDVKKLFLAEAVLIGLIGGGLGALLGNLVVGLMHWQGVPFESPFGADALIIRPTFSGLVTGVIWFLAGLVTVIAAYGPARRAAATAPVSAFKGHLT